MQEKHFIGTVSQKLILRYQDKILVERHKGFWHLPGGRLNENEFLEDGLIREIKEELGIDIQNPKLFKAITFVNRFKEQKFALVYTQELQSLPHLTIQEEEIDEAKWITPEQLNEIKMYNEFKQAIKHYLRHQEEAQSADAAFSLTN